MAIEKLRGDRGPLLAAVLSLAVLAGLGTSSAAVAQNGLPGPLREVGFDQNLGAQVPLDLTFTDEDGQEVTLAELTGERPVVLTLVYYDCPMLCPMVLNGLTTSLRALKFDVGQEFDVVVVSFDPREGAELAQAAKSTYTDRYDREGTEGSWHFLTGEPEAIRRLTDSVGFRYVFDEAQNEFAHAAGIVVLTKDGHVGRYLFGVEYAPRDLRLALIEATDNKIGSVVDQLLLYCYNYDPAVGRYSAVAMNIVRLGAAATIFCLALFILLMLWRDRRLRLAGAKA